MVDVTNYVMLLSISVVYIYPAVPVVLIIVTIVMKLMCNVASYVMLLSTGHLPTLLLL